VTVDAIALLIAASKKVIRAPGSERRDLGTTECSSTLWSKKVMAGFMVKTRLAEYPDQKPWSPFSSLICNAISFALKPGAMLDVGSLAAIRAAVCFLVTIF